MKKFIELWAEFVVEKRGIVFLLTFLALIVAAYPVYQTVVYEGAKQARTEYELTLGSNDSEESFEDSDDDFGDSDSFEEGEAKEDPNAPPKVKLEDRWLYFDNSNEMWFLDGDSALVLFDKLKERFGDNDYLLINISVRPQDKNVLVKETLQVIHEITEFLENHKFVTKTTSLSKYQYIHSENDTLNTEDLIEDIENLGDDPAEYQKMSDIMAGEELVHDFMISQDLKHTMISARVLQIKENSDHLVALVRETRKFIEDKGYTNQGFKFRMMGNPLVTEQFLTYSIKDTSINLPLMLLITLVFLLFSFRSLSGVLFPWVVIFGSLFAVVGFMGFMGYPFNILNSAIFTLLTVVGIGDSVHVIMDFFHLRAHGDSPKDAAKGAVRALWVPCFNTSLTTSAGFLAVSISDLKPLQEYGYTAAVGVFVAFFISVTTVPALLSLSKGGIGSQKRLSEKGWIARFTAGLTPFTYKYRTMITLVGTVVMVGSIYFASNLSVDANFINYFKDDSPLKKDIVHFDRTYGGGMNLELMIDSGKENGVKELGFLREVLKFQKYMEGLDNTGKANSIINYIRKMNQSMNNDDPAAYDLPDGEGSELVAQYLFLYENSGPEEDLSDLKTPDFRYMRLSLPVRNMSTGKLKVLFSEIIDYQKKNFPTLKVEATGTMVLFNNMDTYMLQGLIKSFSLAIGIIILCFFVLFRSIKYGFLALVPSLFPIIFAGGVMNLMGLTLDFSTMMIAAVTFGIAVDDSIHVMSRYIKGRRNGVPRQEAMHYSLTESGRAVVFSSIILCAGFLVSLGSSFLPNVYFGFFGAIIIMMALFSDLIILPAFIFFLEGVFKPGEAQELPKGGPKVNVG